MTARVGRMRRYAALFIPGGHAPMIDLWPSVAVARIISHFWTTGRVVAAICHGPVTLASTSLLPGSWPFAGLNMTVFSKPAEIVNEAAWGAKLGFYPEDVLRALGGNVIEAPMYHPHVVRDGQLITGQNPASAELLAAALLEALAEMRA
jgi:putative intracellular protease/amidase